MTPNSGCDIASLLPQYSGLGATEIDPELMNAHEFGSCQLHGETAQSVKSLPCRLEDLS